MNKIKVGLFFGGMSVEHEVSIISALQAYKNIDKEKYDVIPIYITKDNEMYVGPFIGEIKEYSNIKLLLNKSIKVILINNKGKVEIVKENKFFNRIYDYLDIALPIVHGSNMEDGTLAGLFKFLRLPWVGSDILSSALGMDKYMMKEVLKQNNIPVLDCLVFNQNDYDQGINNLVAKIEKEFKYTVIVKPINLGSSIGINRADNKDELINAIDESYSFANKILIEPCINDLREINCSVLGNGSDAKASICEEPITKDRILSYEDKYMTKQNKLSDMSGATRKLPAEISKEETKTIQEYALKTFASLGCRGVARIDFLMDTKAKKIYVNEINTIPGSLSFYLWEESKIKYTELLDILIKMTLDDEKKERNIKKSFATNILENAQMGIKGKLNK